MNLDPKDEAKDLLVGVKKMFISVALFFILLLAVVVRTITLFFSVFVCTFVALRINYVERAMTWTESSESHKPTLL